MPRQCAAYGCNNYGSKRCGFSFFSFPKNAASREKWRRYTKRDFEVTDHHRLCSKHFSKEMYSSDPKWFAKTGCRSAVPRLKTGAVPDMPLENELVLSPASDSESEEQQQRDSPPSNNKKRSKKKNGPGIRKRRKVRAGDGEPAEAETNQHTTQMSEARKRLCELLKRRQNLHNAGLKTCPAGENASQSVKRADKAKRASHVNRRPRKLQVNSTAPTATAIQTQICLVLVKSNSESGQPPVYSLFRKEQGQPQVTPIVNNRPAQPQVCSVDNLSAEQQVFSVVNNRQAQGHVSSAVNNQWTQPQLSSVVSDQLAQPQVFPVISNRLSQPEVFSVVNNQLAQGQVSSVVNDQLAQPQLSSVVSDQLAQPQAFPVISNRLSQPEVLSVVNNQPDEPCAKPAYNQYPEGFVKPVIRVEYVESADQPQAVLLVKKKDTHSPDEVAEQSFTGQDREIMQTESMRTNGMDQIQYGFDLGGANPSQVCTGTASTECYGEALDSTVIVKTEYAEDQMRVCVVPAEACGETLGNTVVVKKEYVKDQVPVGVGPTLHAGKETFVAKTESSDVLADHQLNACAAQVTLSTCSTGIQTEPGDDSEGNQGCALVKTETVDADYLTASKSPECACCDAGPQVVLQTPVYAACPPVQGGEHQLLTIPELFAQPSAQGLGLLANEWSAGDACRVHLSKDPSGAVWRHILPMPETFRSGGGGVVTIPYEEVKSAKYQPVVKLEKLHWSGSGIIKLTGPSNKPNIGKSALAGTNCPGQVGNSPGPVRPTSLIASKPRCSMNTGSKFLKDSGQGQRLRNIRPKPRLTLVQVESLDASKSVFRIVGDMDDASDEQNFPRSRSRKKGVHLCHVCDKKFPNKSSLKTHIARHRGERMTCEVCQKRVSAPYIQRHLKLHNDPSLSKPFMCYLCGFRFPSRTSLKQHMFKHTGERETCPVCHKSIACGYFKAHVKAHETPQKKPFQCTLCDKAFHLIGKLNRHMLCHKGVREICPVCKNSFSADYLRRHMVLHKSVEVPFHCSVCSRRFRGQAAYRRHMVKHGDSGNQNSQKTSENS